MNTYDYKTTYFNDEDRKRMFESRFYGETVREWALRWGVSVPTYYNWKKKFESTHESEEKSLTPPNGLYFVIPVNDDGFMLDGKPFILKFEENSK